MYQPCTNTSAQSSRQCYCSTTGSTHTDHSRRIMLIMAGRWAHRMFRSLKFLYREYSIQCIHDVHNSTIVGTGWGVLCGVCRNIFLVFHFQKGVQVIIGLKSKIRIMSRVTMLKVNIIYKRCLVIFIKSCLKCLKLSAQLPLVVSISDKAEQIEVKRKM